MGLFMCEPRVHEGQVPLLQLYKKPLERIGSHSEAIVYKCFCGCILLGLFCRDDLGLIGLMVISRQSISIPLNLKLHM